MEVDIGSAQPGYVGHSTTVMLPSQNSGNSSNPDTNGDGLTRTPGVPHLSPHLHVPYPVHRVLLHQHELRRHQESQSVIIS
ncbi:hypothetical protein BT69DRAFT_1280117 [Atractiella rhizophila]|nr:hypothetical protein BT69DRAFT_1280117 [Atractiella rhizophila]